MLLQILGVDLCFIFDFVHSFHLSAIISSFFIIVSSSAFGMKTAAHYSSNINNNYLKNGDF